MKEFNTTGICVPSMHYMVDVGEKIAEIKKLIDKGSYFTINRGRQYGKTTMLYEIRRHLSDEYLVIKISFEGLGDESFSSAKEFCATLLKLISRSLLGLSVSAEKGYAEKWLNKGVVNFDSLCEHITVLTQNKKIILMIDEVDRTSNNQVFLHFLSMLRKKFLAARAGDDTTFHSVILAGVHDIKNIKSRIGQFTA